MKSNVFAKAENLHINLTVDPEGKPVSFSLIGAYLDNKPVQFGSYDNNGGKFTIGIPI